MMQGLPSMRRRVPAWLATLRMQQSTSQRTSMAAFRGWATATRPQVRGGGFLLVREGWPALRQQGGGVGLMSLQL